MSEELGIQLYDTPPVDALAPYDAVAIALMSHPGKWARVRTCDSRKSAQSTAHRIRKGQVHAFRRSRGQFDADVVTTATETHEVWASRLPDPSTPDAREMS